MDMLFILGYRRSGTTVLQRQMQLHSDIWYFDGGVIPSGKRRNEFHLFDLVDSAPTEYEALFRYHCGRTPSGDPTVDAEAVFATCRRPIGLVKSTRILMRRRAWERFTAWAKVTPHRVRLLGIVRFPLDTLSSDNEKFAHTQIPDARTLRPGTAQEVWSEAYARLLQEAPGVGDLHWLRLEDLVSQPIERMKAITEWLGLPPFLRFMDWKPVHQGRGRTDPAFSNFSLSPSVREIAARLGYDI